MGMSACEAMATTSEETQIFKGNEALGILTGSRSSVDNRATEVDTTSSFTAPTEPTRNPGAHPATNRVCDSAPDSHGSSPSSPGNTRIGSAPTSANATQKGRKSRQLGNRTVKAEAPQYSVALGRKRRRVVRPQRVDQILDAEEEYMLNLALANSRVDVGVERIDVPDAPVYRPTLKEFEDPLAYVASIRPEAEKYGICTIVPPEGWNPPYAIAEDNKKLFKTRKQQINRLQEGRGFDDGKFYTCKEYKQMADSFRNNWCKAKGQGASSFSVEDAEADYWKVVQTGVEEVTVEYGNDIDTSYYGSGFPRPPEIITNRQVKLGDPGYYESCDWNLNNLPTAQGSLLRYVKAPIKGVNVPWLYYGMLFSTFCWHNEDSYLYSMNYMHLGAPKTWYGVPGHHAEALEKVLRKNVPLRFREDPDLMFHLVTMLCPTTLLKNKVKVYRLVQRPGDFTVTFPKAYHAGFSHGFNCGEAVNFATLDWITHGRQCREKYRLFGRPSVFSHEKLMWMLAKQTGLSMNCNTSLLLQEVKQLLFEEVHFRDALVKQGIVKAVRMDVPLSAMDLEGLEDDDRRQCCVCKDFSFSAVVVCPCLPTKVSCLRHGIVMCHCPPRAKYIVFWHGLEALKQLMDRLEIAAMATKRHMQ